MCNLSKKLLLQKSAGADGITAEHLRYAHYCVCIYLSVLFNLCMSHGFIPGDCLITDIVPILRCKNKDATNVSNYRSIAVATMITKFFEHFILFNMKAFFSISDDQFGFKRGTGIDIFLLKQITSSYLQQGSPSFSVFLDASKAFDRISHELLFKKLLLHDVPPCFVRLLRYWFRQQQTRVRWESQLSQSFGVSHGVRQKWKYLVFTYLLSISTKNCQKISIVFLLVVILETVWLTISHMHMMYAVSVLALQDYKIYLMCVIAFLIKMVFFK